MGSLQAAWPSRASCVLNSHYSRHARPHCKPVTKPSKVAATAKRRNHRQSSARRAWPIQYRIGSELRVSLNANHAKLRRVTHPATKSAPQTVLEMSDALKNPSLEPVNNPIPYNVPMGSDGAAKVIGPRRRPNSRRCIPHRKLYTIFKHIAYGRERAGNGTVHKLVALHLALA